MKADDRLFLYTVAVAFLFLVVSYLPLWALIIFASPAAFCLGFLGPRWLKWIQTGKF